MNGEPFTFLQALYEGVEEGFLTLTVIHPDQHRPTPSRHVPIGDKRLLMDTLSRLQSANAQGWGAYFSVATRKTNLGRWRRGGKDDLAALPALFVDLDGDRDMALRQLDGYRFSPSCLVSSGGGIHAYWFIQPTMDWAQASLVLQELASELNGDATNIAQALRLPGTRNLKPNRNGALCHLISLHPERRYQLADFPTSSGTHSDNPPDPYSPPVTSKRLNPRLLQAVVDCLCREYRGFLKANGYLAALCPCGHCRDYPGSHFSLDPVRGVATCFGRHGRLRLKDVCGAMGIDPAAYGGIF